MSLNDAMASHTEDELLAYVEHEHLEMNRPGRTEWYLMSLMSLVAGMMSKRGRGPEPKAFLMQFIKELQGSTPADREHATKLSRSKWEAVTGTPQKFKTAPLPPPRPPRVKEEPKVVKEEPRRGDRRRRTR